MTITNTGEIMDYSGLAIRASEYQDENGNVIIDTPNVTPQELTVSGAVTAGTESVELNHASTIIAATIATAVNHKGLFIVKNTSASGTAAHTLSLTVGTFDGTNDTATLNAPNEALVVYFDSAGNGTIVENIGSVGLS